METSDIELKFEQYRDHLENEVTRLNSYVQLYKHVNKRKQDRLDELNIAPCFFGTVIDSLFTVIILWVNNLVDPEAERGFYNFLSFIENNRGIFAISRLQERNDYPDGHWMLNREPIIYESIESDRKKLKNIKALPSFKIRRDKFHAHFDKDYAFQRKQISSDAPIKFSDLDEVVEVLKGILNTYSAAYNGKVHTMSLMNINDIDYVLDILHKYNQNIKS
jgi:hypothetical protein